MEILIFWLAAAIAVGVWASNRGRNGFGYFLLSVVLSPLIGVIFVAVSKNLAAGTASGYVPTAATHVKCPDCRELVLPDANVCKHCGVKLTPDHTFHERIKQEADAKEDTDAANLRIGIGAIAGLIFFAWVFSKFTG